MKILAVFAFFMLPFILFLGMGATTNTTIPANFINNASIAMQINNTMSYVKEVNGSAYLIFYPNLSIAYNDINAAKNVSGNKSKINYLLSSAKNNAIYENNMLNDYRYISFIVMIFFAIISGFILYKFTVPYKNKIYKIKNKNKKKE